MHRRDFLKASATVAATATTIDWTPPKLDVVYVNGRAPFRLFGNTGAPHDPCRTLADGMARAKVGGTVNVSSVHIEGPIPYGHRIVLTNCRIGL